MCVSHYLVALKIPPISKLVMEEDGRMKYMQYCRYLWLNGMLVTVQWFSDGCSVGKGLCLHSVLHLVVILRYSRCKMLKL